MNEKIDYVIRVLNSPLEVNGSGWNALLALQSPDGALNPFMRHEYLTAMHSSGSSSWSSASDAESHLHQMESPTSMQIHEVNEAKERAYEEWHKSVNS